MASATTAKHASFFHGQTTLQRNARASDPPPAAKAMK